MKMLNRFGGKILVLFVGLLLVSNFLIQAGADSFQVSAYLRNMYTYIKLSDGTKASSYEVNYIAYFKADGDNYIQTEDSWDPLKINAGYNLTGAPSYYHYTRVQADYLAATESLTDVDSYRIWVSSVLGNTTTTQEANNVEKSAIGSSNPSYTTPGNTTGNSLLLNRANYLDMPGNYRGNAGDLRVVLRWDQVPAASEYRVYRRPVPANANKVYEKIGTVSSNSILKYEDTSVSNGNTYYYIIVATDGTSPTKISPHTDEIAATPNSPAPKLIKLWANSGSIGDKVTITGESFGVTEGTIEFHGAIVDPANVNWSNGASGIVTVEMVPAGATTGNVYLIDSTGMISNGLNFTITAPSGPNVISVSPGYGFTNSTTDIVINGTSFTGVTAVTIEGTGPLTFHYSSATSIEATIPSGLSEGVKNVRVTTGVGTSPNTVSDDFTVVGVPSISNVNPSTGANGSTTPVTITGNNLLGTTTVTLDTTSLTGVTVVNNTTITGTVPSGLTPAVYDIMATNPVGTSPNTSADNFTVTAKPTVTSVTPNYGYNTGTTAIIINGTNFVGITGVSLDLVTPLLSYVVTDTTSITAVVQSGLSVAARNVRVTTASQQSDDTASDNFAVLGAPTVTSVVPAFGFTNSATDIIINGTNLLGASAVALSGTPVSSYVVTSNTSITAVVPSGLSTGVKDVRVTTGAGQSANTGADDFRVVGAPSITGVVPNNGSNTAPTIITINGSDLLGTTGVTIEWGSLTNFVVMSNTQITAEVPAGLPLAVYNVRATNPVGTSADTINDNYTVVALPTVTSVAPSYGYNTGTTNIVINGTNFVGVTAVNLDSTPVSSYVVTDTTSITAVVQSGLSVGVKNIRVVSPAGTSANTGADDFTVLGAPTVTSVSPNYGFTTSTRDIVINGTNLLGASAVELSGTPMSSFVVTSTTSITAVVPSGLSTGVKDVRVTTGAGQSANTSADNYTVVGAPSITNINPTSGSNGSTTPIIITGTNLLGTTLVSIDAVNVLSFTVNNNTQISATIQSGLTVGVYDISATNPVGTSANTSADDYTVVALPTVTSVTPSSGYNNVTTSIVINGTNFAGVSAVNLDAVAISSYVVTDTTSITAVVQSALAAGVKNIRVITPAGTSANTASDDFMVVGQPVIRKVTPKYGFTTTTTGVVITGESFLGATDLSLGGTPVSFVVTSNSSITAIVPPSFTEGLQDFTVTNPVGTNANTTADDFTVVGLPTITNVNPPSGANGSTTPVTITGTNFLGCTNMYIDVLTVSSYTVNNNTQISAVIQSGITAGTYEITCVNPVGTSAIVPVDQFVVIESIGDTTGPTIESVSIDGKRVIGGEIVNQTFVLTAIITDELSAIGTIEVYLDEYSGTPLKLIPAWPHGVANRMFVVVTIPEEAMNLASHLIRIVARDSVGNETVWIGTAVLMKGKVQVIGPIYNHPNPFRPLSTDPNKSNTTIQYTLSTDAPIAVIIYDIAGHEVHRRVYSSGVEGGHAGINQVLWNGKSLFGEAVGNGMYVYLIVSGSKVIGSGKLVVQD